MRTLSLVILGLFVLSCAPKPLKFQNVRNLAGYYAQPGTFDLVSNEEGIVQQQPGVYVNVLFDKQTNGSGSLDFNKYGGTMMMSLYSSKTMLIPSGEKCLDFEAYNCTTHTCIINKDQSDSFAYTDFSVTGGFEGNATVLIEKNYWSLNHSVLWATDCESYKNRDDFGEDIDGILGLGIEGDAITNFPTHQTYDSIMGGSETITTGKPAIFSFFLNDDGKYGQLIFQADMDKVKTTTPVVTFSSDLNWHVSGVTGVQVGNTVFPLTTKLIFDINSEALGFPLETYKKVVKAIQDSVKDLECPADINYQPQCKYSGKMENLPTLYINVMDSVHEDQVITLYPETYAKQVKEMDLPSDKIVLNIRGISSDVNVKNQSYVTEGYSNYVILDQHVMGYYYTVFDTARTKQEDPLTIKMYLANHGNSSKALITVIVCTVIGLIVGLSIYRYKKIQKARMAQSSTSPLLQTELNPLQPNRSYR